MIAKIQPSCAGCKFFKDVGNPNGLGECNRYPPKVDNMLVGWKGEDPSKGEPIIHRVITPGMTPSHGWCGEYVTKIALPSASFTVGNGPGPIVS